MTATRCYTTLDPYAYPDTEAGAFAEVAGVDPTIHIREAQKPYAGSVLTLCGRDLIARTDLDPIPVEKDITSHAAPLTTCPACLAVWRSTDGKPRTPTPAEMESLLHAMLMVGGSVLACDGLADLEWFAIPAEEWHDRYEIPA